MYAPHEYEILPHFPRRYLLTNGNYPGFYMYYILSKNTDEVIC